MSVLTLVALTLTIMWGVSAERIELSTCDAFSSFSNTSIWTPRAPMEGDDVVLDFTLCSTTGTLSFDEDTPSFASITVIGDATVFVGQNVRVITSRYEQGSSCSLVLQGGAQIQAHVFEADGIISGNGRIISGTLARISATLAPGVYPCWGSNAAEYGDLVFEGLGQVVENVSVYLRNALSPVPVGRYPGDTVVFTAVRLNATRFVWQKSNVSPPNDISVLPVSYTALTVETPFSFDFGVLPCSDDNDTNTGFVNTITNPGPKRCPTLDGGALGFLLQLSDCADSGTCPSCVNGVCAASILFCQCSVGWSGVSCDVPTRVAPGSSDSTVETSSATDTPASSGQEMLSQGAIVGIAVGVSAAAVLIVVGLFLGMRAHRRASTMDMASKIRARELQDLSMPSTQL